MDRLQFEIVLFCIIPTFYINFSFLLNFSMRRLNHLRLYNISDEIQITIEYIADFY